MKFKGKYGVKSGLQQRNVFTVPWKSVNWFKRWDGDAYTENMVILYAYLIPSQVKASYPQTHVNLINTSVDLLAGLHQLKGLELTFPHPSQKWSSSNQRESKWHATTLARRTMKRSASYYKPAKSHKHPDTLELPLHNCVSYATAHSKLWTLGKMVTHCARSKGVWTLPSFVTLVILQLSTRHW
jgi:hypothetical protein